MDGQQMSSVIYILSIVLLQLFIHGVDVSSYLSEVQSGVKWYDENGKEKNLFAILKDAGVNYVRLRVWNCPFAVDADGNIKYVNSKGTEYTADKVEKTTKNVKGYTEYFLADGTQVYREGYGAGNIDADTAAVIGKEATKYGKYLCAFKGRQRGRPRI